MRPILIAIVGGSGCGKSLLAARLQGRFGHQAAHLSLDAFYRDRSHLPPLRRAGLNFDRPQAIEWAAAEQILRECLAGKRVLIPQYDFVTHSRSKAQRWFAPKPFILVDGLWLLRRPDLRTLFDLRIFIDCSARTRLLRRLARDQRSRGRTASSVRQQFRTMVEPMHARYVAPQARWADVILNENWGKREVDVLVRQIRALKGRPLVG